MVKDTFFRLLFIPLLGLCIPYLSRIVTYSNYSGIQLLGIHSYFIFMSWSIWAGSSWLHHTVRKWFTIYQNTFIKISTVSLTNAIFGGAIAGILTITWYRISGEAFSWNPYLLCVMLSVFAVIVFTLVYEILYLSKERQYDDRIVHQLDHEKTVAELSNLKNEIEPHFIFNSLTALSYLIVNDAPTAHTFNTKLATIYKYFLVNKERETISLDEELDFINDYIYLLRLRHDDAIELITGGSFPEKTNLLILPFALQITVENAIKHNEFGVKNPLRIRMELERDHVLVTNEIKPKTYSSDSTGIGLRNLRLRYTLFCKKDIKIETTHNEFKVKIPVITQNLQP